MGAIAFGSQLEVKPHFLGHVGVETPAVKQGAEAMGEVAKPAHVTE
jgi:hypothetical protein